MSNRTFKAIFTIVVLVSLFAACMGALNERVREPQSAIAQPTGKVFNVREFGATGYGISNDTAAIQKAIDTAPAGSTIYFPAGTYDVSNFVVKNRSGLSFVGEGRKSVIRQKTGAARIATFDGARDIVIEKLTFDANGIGSYGGVVFYAMTGVRIEDNIFIDSAPKPIGSTDRYSFVFGRGSVPSRDLRIVNNLIEDLQLEVDHSQGVIIDRNHVKRSVKTGAIGIFTVGDGAIAEDYQITNNTVVDSTGTAFNVEIDPPTSNNCVFRRITIAGNQIVRNNTSSYGIRIGTPNNSVKTTGNVFEHIRVSGNRIMIESTAPPPLQVIFANSSAAAAIVFNELTIADNIIEVSGHRNKGFAIDLRQVRNSHVFQNRVTGVSHGISLAGNVQRNLVQSNIVDASDIAYRLEESSGENRAIRNSVIGKPRHSWLLSELKPSDSIEHR